MPIGVVTTENGVTVVKPGLAMAKLSALIMKSLYGVPFFSVEASPKPDTYPFTSTFTVYWANSLLSSVIRAVDSVCTAALAAPATTAVMLVSVDDADVADPAALVAEVAAAV